MDMLGYCGGRRAARSSPCRDAQKPALRGILAEAGILA